jgi:protein-disulfide isomerase
MLAAPIGDQDHVQGPATAPVTLLAYGDFECPFSRQAAGHIKILRAQYGDRLRFVFRHFPLTVKHPHAQRAAEAAEAAGSQGRFWEMAELLFANQDRLSDASLLRYAARVGLETHRFEQELVAHVHAERVKTDVLSGGQSGVTGTPTFFINGRRHDGPDDVSGLSAAIQQALARG